MTEARLSVAVGVSLALHGLAIAALQPAGSPLAGALHRAPLLVRLGAAPAAAPQPVALVEALPVPPAPTPTKRDTAPAREAAPEPVLQLLPVPEVPRYFTASELDRRPAPLGEIFPQFPAGAAVRQGTVRLRVLVNESGTVDGVSVVSAAPAGVFDASAVAAFGGARYSPGMRGGMAVKSQLVLEVDYADPIPAQQRFASNRGGY
ncbi:MAG TPA: energy transducer TonB [Burkholderiales bacterium]|nr:energy transducer TonB [Burkholderiales bacterium]